MNIQVKKVTVCPKVTKISFSFVHIVNHTVANTSQKKYWRNVKNHSESVCIDSCSYILCQRKVSQLCELANIQDRLYKTQTTQGLTSPLYCLINRIRWILLKGCSFLSQPSYLHHFSTLAHTKSLKTLYNSYLNIGK